MTDHDRETYQSDEWRKLDRQWLMIRVVEYVLVFAIGALAVWLVYG
jgi:hypothetical protein